MEPVLVALDAGVLRVTLNRPAKLNAFNPAMHEGLAGAMARAETDAAVGCVLVTGSGRAFCAGQDLSERDMTVAGPIDLGEGLETRYNPLVRRMRALAAGPTKSLGLMKKALYLSADNTLDAQLDLERDLQREVGKGEDYREGVTAFLEKRKPKFTGR